jgi:DNA polymerase III alpha subunit
MLYTQYSLLDGAMKIKDLAGRAKEFCYPVVTITNPYGIDNKHPYLRG